MGYSFSLEGFLHIELDGKCFSCLPVKFVSGTNLGVLHVFMRYDKEHIHKMTLFPPVGDPGSKFLLHLSQISGLRTLLSWSRWLVQDKDSVLNQFPLKQNHFAEPN